MSPNEQMTDPKDDLAFVPVAHVAHYNRVSMMYYVHFVEGPWRLLDFGEKNCCADDQKSGTCVISAVDWGIYHPMSLVSTRSHGNQTEKAFDLRRIFEQPNFQDSSRTFPDSNKLTLHKAAMSESDDTFGGYLPEQGQSTQPPQSGASGDSLEADLYEDALNYEAEDSFFARAVLASGPRDTRMTEEEQAGGVPDDFIDWDAVAARNQPAPTAVSSVGVAGRAFDVVAHLENLGAGRFGQAPIANMQQPGIQGQLLGALAHRPQPRGPHQQVGAGHAEPWVSPSQRAMGQSRPAQAPVASGNLAQSQPSQVPVAPGNVARRPTVIDSFTHPSLFPRVEDEQPTPSATRAAPGRFTHPSVSKRKAEQQDDENQPAKRLVGDVNTRVDTRIPAAADGRTVGANAAISDDSTTGTGTGTGTGLGFGMAVFDHQVVAYPITKYTVQRLPPWNAKGANIHSRGNTEPPGEFARRWRVNLWGPLSIRPLPAWVVEPPHGWDERPPPLAERLANSRPSATTSHGTTTTPVQPQTSTQSFDVRVSAQPSNSAPAQSYDHRLFAPPADQSAAGLNLRADSAVAEQGQANLPSQAPQQPAAPALQGFQTTTDRDFLLSLPGQDATPHSRYPHRRYPKLLPSPPAQVQAQQQIATAANYLQNQIQQQLVPAQNQFQNQVQHQIAPSTEQLQNQIQHQILHRYHGQQLSNQQQDQNSHQHQVTMEPSRNPFRNRMPSTPNRDQTGSGTIDPRVLVKGGAQASQSPAAPSPRASMEDDGSSSSSIAYGGFGAQSPQPQQQNQTESSPTAGLEAVASAVLTAIERPRFHIRSQPASLVSPFRQAVATAVFTSSPRPQLPPPTAGFTSHPRPQLPPPERKRKQPPSLEDYRALNKFREAIGRPFVPQVPRTPEENQARQEEGTEVMAMYRAAGSPREHEVEEALARMRAAEGPLTPGPSNPLTATVPAPSTGRPNPTPQESPAAQPGFFDPISPRVVAEQLNIAGNMIRRRPQRIDPLRRQLLPHPLQLATDVAQELNLPGNLIQYRQQRNGVLRQLLPAPPQNVNQPLQQNAYQPPLQNAYEPPQQNAYQQPSQNQASATLRGTSRGRSREREVGSASRGSSRSRSRESAAEAGSSSRDSSRCLSREREAGSASGSPTRESSRERLQREYPELWHLW
ncbi:hypothetical protein V8F33_003785 [Rhypophila sp. PSN 637]